VKEAVNGGIGSNRMNREKREKVRKTENGEILDMEKFMRKEGRIKPIESVGKEHKEQSNRADDTYK
jgi:hypothetical protein